MSDNIQWHKDLDVGHDRIDFEHKIFLALIKNISIAAAENKSREHLTRLLMELERYAQFHFFSEENIALENGEPEREISAHSRIHHYLLAELHKKIERHHSGEEGSDEIAQFLVDWFGLHAQQDRERVKRFEERTQTEVRKSKEPKNS
jgi:hemerythrin